MNTDFATGKWGAAITDTYTREVALELVGVEVRRVLRCCQKILDLPEEAIGRTMAVQAASGEIPDRNEERVIGHWRQGGGVLTW